MESSWPQSPFGIPPGGGLERAYRMQTILDLASAHLGRSYNQAIRRRP